jgi:hypothetical protein
MFPAKVDTEMAVRRATGLQAHRKALGRLSASPLVFVTHHEFCAKFFHPALLDSGRLRPVLRKLRQDCDE